MDYMNNGMYQQEDNAPKSKFRAVFLIGAILILVAVIAVGAIVLMSASKNEKKYVQLVNLGNDYFAAGDYYNAIIQYQQALEVDEKDEATYINMSTIYMIVGDYSSAKSIVLRGLEFCDSQILRDRLNELDGKSVQAEEQLKNLSDTQIEALASAVTTESSAFDMVAAYTHTDYCRDYKSMTSANWNNNELVVNYTGANFLASYSDSDNERCVDTAKNTPMAAVKPRYVSFQSVRSLFSSKEDIFVISYSRLSSILTEIQLTHDDAMNRYIVTGKCKGCKLSIETDANGNVVSENAWNKVEPLSRQGRDVEENVEGEVSGYVQDALTGNGMRATIKIRERGRREGQVIGEITSAVDGKYTFEGEAGKYTLEVSAQGYVTEYMDAEIVRGQIKTGKNIVLSPTVGTGEIRIVLSWGATPTDLDSHVQGRSSSGSNFHIFYSNKSVNNVGTLDVDDTNGYGPETVTITDANSTFVYSVEDFTNSSTMSSSGAIVKVYLPGNSQPIIYNVPSGTGNTWKVFEYKDGQIAPINTLN